MAQAAVTLGIALAFGSLAIVFFTSVHQRWAFWTAWAMALTAIALLILSVKVHP